MKVGLRIEVNTYRGTRDGVPRLMNLLKQFRAGAELLQQVHQARDAVACPAVGVDLDAQAYFHEFRES